MPVKRVIPGGATQTAPGSWSSVSPVARSGWLTTFRCGALSRTPSNRYEDGDSGAAPHYRAGVMVVDEVRWPDPAV